MTTTIGNQEIIKSHRHITCINLGIPKALKEK
jgi:hypothetical protein